MAESLSFTRSADRRTIYAEITPQIEALIAGEVDMVANMANVAAVLRDALGFFWVGFYVSRDGELVLGPFQGPIACTRIAYDRGVCGHAFTTKETVIVPDVDQFPGHIPCASTARSEIVVPIFGPDGNVFAVLDVDSDRSADFTETDRAGLETIIRIFEKTLPNDK